MEDEHPSTSTVRRFLNAWFDGDLATWTSLAAEDIVIHIRGNPPLTGTYRGQAAVLSFFERFGVALLHTAYRRGAESIDLRDAATYRIDGDGRIAEVWTVSDNQTALLEFFSIVDADPSGLGIGLGPQ
ncbi:MAG: uncharacterized protein QOE93_934 [Actinomycetota bacterium]|nr:uncharacterized protein [Actinomycetota bacterium]